jgi:hypothetical protein
MTNDQGLIVFKSNLSNSAQGLFVYDVAGNFLQAILPGETIQTAPGQFKTIQDINVYLDMEDVTNAGSPYWVGSNGNDGRQSALNDANQLAIWAQFSDSTSGIFLIAVPEPATLFGGIVGLLALCRHYSRRRQRQIRSSN